jgi:hypothetical protein
VFLTWVQGYTKAEGSPMPTRYLVVAIYQHLYQDILVMLAPVRTYACANLALVAATVGLLFWSVGCICGRATAPAWVNSRTVPPADSLLPAQTPNPAWDDAGKKKH